MTGLVVLAFLAVLLAFGGSAVACVPKLAIGALLFYVGLDVLLGALLNVHLRRAGAEFAIAMMVLATVAFVGLLQGLLLGVVAGVVLFVIKYSQVDVVRRESSAVERHSNVVRPPHARQLLNALGEQVMILELQGYLFFGTSTLLVNRIRDRIKDHSGPIPRFVLLDFRRVTGLDSSVSLSLDKLVQYGRDARCTLVLTALAPPLRRPFERMAIVSDIDARLPDPDGSAAGLDAGSRICAFTDLDRGLEYCENRLLASSAAGDGEDAAFETQLRTAGGSEAEIALLMRYAERRTYAPDEPLIRQGEQSRDLFFVEHGMVTVRLDLPDGRRMRLRSMGAGTVVGEIAAYLDLPRSASVVADCETRAVRIGHEALAAMHARDPHAASLLHAFMARQLAEKLVAATQQLGAAQG
jgi:SulP family sulfate permease